MFLQDLFRRRQKKPDPPRVAAKVAAPVRSKAPRESDGLEAFSEMLGIDLSSLPPEPTRPDETDAPLLAAVRAQFKDKPPALEALPALSLQVLQLVAQPDAGYHALASLISRDPALSASVLQVGNSAFYQAAQPIQTIREALTRLGLQEVARVAGIVAARSLFNPRLREERALFGERFAQLRKDAATAALASSWLALECPGVQPDRAFLGGLLHDVGYSLALRSLASCVLDRQVTLPAETSRIDRLMETVHVELGDSAHEIWKLPEALRFVCAHHHHMGVTLGTASAEFHVVRLVSAYQRWLQAPALHPRAPWEVLESARALRLRSVQLRMLSTELTDAARRVDQLLGET